MGTGDTPSMAARPFSPPCAAYTLTSLVLYHGSVHNRRCGGASVRPRDMQPDVESEMCTGADADGLLSISEDNVRRRCAADAECIGYSIADTGAHVVPVVGWWNYKKAIAGYRTFAKDDYCAIEQDALVVAAMNKFVRHMWRELQVSPNHNPSKLPVRFPQLIASSTGRLRNFSDSVLPPSTRELPVFYPFSGFDYLTARAFFPRASRIVLTSSLPFGDARCFLSDECAAALATAAYRVLHMWGRHSFSWTEEKVMDQLLLDRPAFNMSLGIAPLLLLSLHASNQKLVAIEHHAPTASPTAHGPHHQSHNAHGAHHVTLVTADGMRLTYARLTLGLRPLADDLSMLDELAPLRAPAAEQGASTPRARFGVVIKAAALAWQYVRQPAFTRWLVEHADAVVQDETGLAPSDFGPPARYSRYGLGNRDHQPVRNGSISEDQQMVRHHGHWVVRGFGNYSALIRAYGTQNIAEAWQFRFSNASIGDVALEWRNELTDFYSTSTPLPFSFGYGDPRGPLGAQASGCLLAAWRHNMDMEHAA